MTSEELNHNSHPATCGYSIYHSGTALCRLECLPCPVLFGKECTRDKTDKMVKAFGEMLQGLGDGNR